MEAGLDKAGLRRLPWRPRNLSVTTDERLHAEYRPRRRHLRQVPPGIEERLLASVHGRARDWAGRPTGPRRAARRRRSRPAPRATRARPASPESVAFREAVPDRCGNCHAAMSSLYALSMHGKLTDLGYGPAAKCADCHGSHDILPLGRSQLHALAGEPGADLREVPCQRQRQFRALQSAHRSLRRQEEPGGPRRPGHAC